MRAATKLHRKQQLIALDSDSDIAEGDAADQLANYLQSGDLVIVNDAATLPASFRATTQSGHVIELRLVQRREASVWLCLALGSGSWQEDTNQREAPPSLKAGAFLRVSEALSAHIVDVSILSDRLVTIRFDATEVELLAALYQQGDPIQYSYHHRRLPLSWLQSPYAGRPWAIEMPSAGRAMTWQTISRMRARGVRIARLTHSAGVSATGLPELDVRLPFQEHYDIPLETIEAIDVCRVRNGRVIAVGTTVVRALEGCVHERGKLLPGEGNTRLVLDEHFEPAVVDGVLAGIHGPGESHFRLLSAFAQPKALKAAWNCAVHLGYQNHELGDAMLVAPGLGIALRNRHVAND
jgi:S-adenosylmethionine:tRNA ribosyltransferase-isomerase